MSRKRPVDVLKQYWGFESFRPRQEEIIDSILHGKDTLALLPTGGGKSICFQVPTLAMGGLCLVISPLVALMKDQVHQLRRRGITAIAIYSGMSRKELTAAFRLAAESNCRFLYVSPERLETDLFREWLPALKPVLIAVDEAHCVSQWGYDFRPPYLRIAAIREELPGIPVLALTASATPLIQTDICDKLKMADAAIFTQSFLRPNLSYSAQASGSINNKMLEIYRRLPGSAIIYCRNRRRTKEISDLLKLHGIKSDYYHAGLLSEERSVKQDLWMKNDIRVIVCTNAFGMGIDKPDVRLVLHVEIPDNLESYYQEAGRAGRDGEKSYAVLLYNEKMKGELKDLHKLQFPPVSHIREVYRGLVHYLQIPLGTEQVSYDFDFPDFIKRFSFDSKSAQAALQVLEQEDYISLNDPVFKPATFQFTGGREELEQFEADHPELDPLIKTLLRSYSGILDQPVPVFEKMLASLLAWPPEKVKKGLSDLQRFQLAVYSPQKEKPQLFLARSRVGSSDIRIDAKTYAFRKEQFVKRVKAMLAYLDTAGCRSSSIAGYFGETLPHDCGICDNCVKKQKLSAAEFQEIYRRLREKTRSVPLTARELFDEFSDIHQEHLRRVIDSIQAENKMTVDEEGIVKISE